MKKLGFGTMRLPLINPEDKTSIDQNYFNQLADKFIEKGFKTASLRNIVKMA